MKFKKILIVSCCFILSFTNISSATSTTTTDDVKATQISISEWNEFKDSDTELKSSKMRSNIEFDDIENQVLSNDDTFILHNDGKPISSNINVENETNLFAIFIDDIDGNLYTSYYFENVDSVDSESLIDDVSKAESINISNYENINISAETNAIKNLTWTYKDPVLGNKVAVVTTSLNAVRKSSTSTMSVWDIKTTSQLEITISGLARINQQRTRLSLAKSSTEKLIDWAPDSNGSSSEKVSLDGIVTPSTWEFQVSGYKYKDLSSMSGRYGRWEFNSAILPSSKWKSKPGIRATNSKGQFYVEVSHTANINSGIPLSADVKGVYFADR